MYLALIQGKWCNIGYEVATTLASEGFQVVYHARMRKAGK